MKKIFVILGIVILISSCASNKANRKLKRAERLTEQAIALGAEVKNDTVMSKFKLEGASASFNFNTILNRKESTRERPILKDTTIYIKDIMFKKQDSLIYIKCPDVEGEVPTVITKKIKTGLGALIVVQWSILSLIIGAVLARIFWK